MRGLFLLLIILLLAGTTFGQNGKFTLETKITAHKYCGGIYTDTAMLNMSLQLTYRNETSQSIILYKGSNLISYILVGANSQQILNKQYEANIHVGWVTSDIRLGEHPQPSNKFAVLRPGESFQTNGDASIAIALEPGTQFLKPGDHVLQVVIETWPADERQLSRLRKKWQRSGFLWGDNIRSEPMPFNVEMTPKIVECK